jgi:CHAD domain-containing protein
VLEPLAGLERADEPDDELQAVIRTHAEQMAARELGTRLGADPEELHKFRVATRRIRSLLRSTRGLVTDPEESERLRAELEWLASLLGEVRDRDVLIEYLLGELESLDGAPFGAVLKLLDEERDEDREELVAGLDSPRYRQLVDDLAHPPRLRDGETLTGAAKGDYQRLRKTMNGLGGEPTDEELHRARIKAKRARYAVEAAEISSSFVKRAKELQDVLGEHQDAVVAEARVRELLAQVRGSGRTAFAAGRLVERQIARRAAARDAWKPAWRKLEKAGSKIF